MSWCPRSHLLRHVCRQGPTLLSGTVLSPFLGRDSSQRSAAASCLPGPVGCCRTTVPLPVTSQTNRSAGTSHFQGMLPDSWNHGHVFYSIVVLIGRTEFGKRNTDIFAAKTLGAFDYGRGRDRQVSQNHCLNMQRSSLTDKIFTSAVIG